jgi:hypothetical protein
MSYTGTSKFPFRELRERTKLNRPAIVSYVDGQMDSMVQVGQDRSEEMQWHCEMIKEVRPDDISGSDGCLWDVAPFSLVRMHWNVGRNLPDYVAQHPRRQPCS